MPRVYLSYSYNFTVRTNLCKFLSSWCFSYILFVNTKMIDSWYKSSIEATLLENLHFLNIGFTTKYWIPTFLSSMAMADPSIEPRQMR